MCFFFQLDTYWGIRNEILKHGEEKKKKKSVVIILVIKLKRVQYIQDLYSILLHFQIRTLNVRNHLRTWMSRDVLLLYTSI